jgi:hypothetical protein
MDPLNLKSELEMLVSHTSVASYRNLSESEYLRAVQLYCTERMAHHSGLRHADTIDFDHKALRPAIALVPQAVAAKVANDDRARIQALAKIGALAVSAMLEAVNDRLDGYFIERNAPPRPRDTDDTHEIDYRREVIEQRHALNDSLRECVAESAL